MTKALKDKYFTISEAAKESGVTRQTISRWVKEGKLSAEKIGRETLIKKEDLRKYQISLSAADKILDVFVAIRNDYCHKKYDIDTDEWVRRLEKRGGKLYMILEKPDKTVRSFQLPISFEQWHAGFIAYGTPILAKLLSKLTPIIRDFMGDVMPEIKSSKRRKIK